MTVILLMIPISLLLSLGFMAAFLWAQRNGQYDSIDLEAYKILDSHPQLEEAMEKNINQQKHKGG